MKLTQQYDGHLLTRIEDAEQTHFFSCLNSKDSSSQQRPIDWRGPDHEPRIACTSKPIDQLMIVFVTSVYAEFKTQIWYFIQLAVTRLFCTTKYRQPHWTRCTLGDRIDLRTSCHPEELFFTLNRKEAKVFLMSSLMKHLLKSPNKSTMDG